jgi:hypothetical protein
VRHKDEETDTERKAFVKQIMKSVGRSSSGELMPDDAAEADAWLLIAIRQ